MSFNLNALIRDNIRKMKPYSSARSEFTGDDSGAIFLDANEQPQPFEGLPPGINRYPRHNQEHLKRRLSVIKGVKEEQIFLGNGSDEAIDLILRCFAQPSVDQIMVFPPTFGMYGVSASVNDLAVTKVALDGDFMIDVNKTLSAVSANTRVMFICSPNNPSGNLQPKETIRALLENFRGLVVVDEAYTDFSPGASLLPWLDQHPNLIVLQTFSKAWGLAGARVGMAYASKEIIDVLNKVRFPYNLSMPDTQLAVEALNRYAEYQLSIAESLDNRVALQNNMRELPGVVHIYPSDANFLLVKTTNAGELYRFLRDQGVIVRNRSSEPGCEGCLRITVGTPEENQRLVNTWKRFDTRSGATSPETIAEVSDQEMSHLPEGNQTKRIQVVEQREEANIPDARKAVVTRNTSETNITVRLNLDGTGRANIQTGIGFYDHMLHQIARHGLFDLDIIASGDLHIDTHHTIEDTAITLGQAFKKALGNKAGIERYGFALPMDDAHAKVLIDFGGRIYLKWKVKFVATNTGEMPTSLFEHFFRSFAEASAANLHVKAKGVDDHHKIEAIFKAFAKALRMAVDRNNKGILPSTKGTL